MTGADPRGTGLRGSDQPLTATYDTLLVDLDGVVYVGDEPVAGAAAALHAARDHGARVRFLTNNAARTPAAIAERLQGMGIDATTDEVVTAAMAAARQLADRLDPGAPVLVVGGEGVEQALIAAGLRPVRRAADHPQAVVQGWAPDVDWAQLAEAMLAIRAGAAWIATNLDRTLPSPQGPLPGNGSLVAALATATGQTPEATGKPEPALFDTALHAANTQPLMVGDRLDTDIAGARRAGLDSLLVLSGVTDPVGLLTAEPAARPDYIGRDLGAVSRTHPAVQDRPGEVLVGSATARYEAGKLTLTSDADRGDGLDGLRAVCAITWSGTCPVPAGLEALEGLDLPSSPRTERASQTE